MDAREYIKKKYAGMCKCGKDHDINIEDIRIGSDILSCIPELVKKHGHKVFLIADVNTYKAAGEKAAQILDIDIS